MNLRANNVPAGDAVCFVLFFVFMMLAALSELS
jgi:hypothetical protein